MAKKRSVGENIRIAREYQGLSQTDLAAMVKRSQPYIANVEAGRKQITIPLLIELKDALQTTYTFLLDGVHPDKNPDKIEQNGDRSQI